MRLTAASTIEWHMCFAEASFSPATDHFFRMFMTNEFTTSTPQVTHKDNFREIYRVLLLFIAGKLTAPPPAIAGTPAL